MTTPNVPRCLPTVRRLAPWPALAALLLALPCRAAPAAWMAAAPSAQLPPSALASAGPQRGPAQLQLQVSPHAHVFYEPKPWQPEAAPAAAGLPPPRASLGLGFRTAPGGAAGVKGLLKVQLGSDSALHFRPRGGGWTVTYKSQF